MNRLASMFRTVLGQKVFVGLLAMVMMGVVAGGSQLLMSTSAYAASASGCYAYTIRSGDTLSGIGASHNTSVQALAQANHIGNINLIYADQTLCIPTSQSRSSQSWTPPVPVHQYTAQAPASSSVASMISQVFGPYTDSAMRIASCESGFNPGAYNPQPVGGSHAEGVFQILYPSTWSGTSYASSSPYDAWSNINAAHEIFARDGYSWREWECQP
ncbi:MAG: LysM peptidoglycan-binding domain-containing protein [Ktedonobacteraceae bacterium]